MEGYNRKNQAIVADENKILAPVYEFLLDKVVAEADLQLPPPNPFKKNPSLDEIKVAYRSFLSEYLYNTKERIRSLNGFELILLNLKRVPNATLCEKELRNAGNNLTIAGAAWLAEHEDEILNGINQAVEKDEWEFLRPASDNPKISNEEMANVLSHIPPMMELLGISESTFTAIYQIGCQLFAEQKIEEAASVFETLSLLNVTCHEVWFSLGLCYQRLDDLPQSIANYQMAILTNDLNMQTYINLAFCYVAGNLPEEAQHILLVAEKVLGIAQQAESEKAAKLVQIAEAKKMLESGMMHKGV